MGVGGWEKKTNWIANKFVLKWPSHLILQSRDKGHVDRAVGGQGWTIQKMDDWKTSSAGSILKWRNKERTIYFLQPRKFLLEVSQSNIQVDFAGGAPFSKSSQQRTIRGPYRQRLVRKFSAGIPERSPGETNAPIFLFVSMLTLYRSSITWFGGCWVACFCRRILTIPENLSLWQVGLQEKQCCPATYPASCLPWSCCTFFLFFFLILPIEINGAC